MEPSLEDLGRKYQTGKMTHRYLPKFERFLAPLRHEGFDLLEFGVKEGSSIRMWHEYFPAANIVGVDIKPVAIEDDLPRYSFFQGNQADLTLLHMLAQRYKFRLIVDDGSHFWGHQIFTFQIMFPWLEPDGIYICEDILMSYGTLADRYQRGASESAADYFFRVAHAFVGGTARKFTQDEDPLLHFIVNKIRDVTFIRHAVIITT